MITFRLHKTGVPLYLQIIQQVKYAIQTGTLREGDRLPTIKEVIAMVAINPNTVARAYRELEKSGFVKGRTGVGTIVLAPPSGSAQEISPAFYEHVKGLIVEAKKLGLTTEVIESAIRAELLKEDRNESDA